MFGQQEACGDRIRFSKGSILTTKEPQHKPARSLARPDLELILHLAGTGAGFNRRQLERSRHRSQCSNAAAHFPANQLLAL